MSNRKEAKKFEKNVGTNLNNKNTKEKMLI